MSEGLPAAADTSPPRYTPSIRTWGIFWDAERWRGADQRLRLWHPPSSRLSPLVEPAMVCSAFALELYLKCILELEGTTVPYEHDLRSLFRRASDGAQASIRAHSVPPPMSSSGPITSPYFDHEELIEDVDFDVVLNSCRDAFTQLRYRSFSPSLPPPTLWLGNFIVRGARAFILSAVPEWSKALDEMAAGIFDGEYSHPPTMYSVPTLKSSP